MECYWDGLCWTGQHRNSQQDPARVEADEALRREAHAALPREPGGYGSSLAPVVVMMSIGTYVIVAYVSIVLLHSAAELPVPMLVAGFAIVGLSIAILAILAANVGD